MCLCKDIQNTLSINCSSLAFTFTLIYGMNVVILPKVRIFLNVYFY